jgi:hypothetical protein
MGHDPVPELVVIPRAYWRGIVVALVLLGLGAAIGAPIAAINAADAHASFNALEDALADQRDQNADLRQQLECRYVLSADRDRIESEIFVTTALALASAGRREAAAVGLYTAHLDGLAAQLEEANRLRSEAVQICETEPENVLG